MFLTCFILPAPSSEGTQRHALTYDDVVGGTEHFHHHLKISEGTFSDTYKGTVGTETFAVKRFKTVSTLMKTIMA